MDSHVHNNYINNFASLSEEKEPQFVNVQNNEALYRLGYDNYLVKQEQASYPFAMLPPTSRATTQYIPRSYYSPHNSFSPQDVYNMTHGNYIGNSPVHYATQHTIPTGIPVVQKAYPSYTTQHIVQSPQQSYHSQEQTTPPMSFFSSGSFPVHTPVHTSTTPPTTTAQTVTRESSSDSTSEEFALKPTYQTIYRNLFHIMHCKISPTIAANWENCRIYVMDRVGYSGNAKRFKKRPEKGERALLLDCNILDYKGQPLEQCLACKDYFETQKYFKANPECIGRIVLIKNNSPIRVDNGQFKLQVKMMCCCIHHSLETFLFCLTLTNAETNEPALSCKVSLSVKQWRKSNQRKEECTVMLE